MAAENTLESRTGVLYGKVRYESQALYDGNDKKLLTYDASLASLRSRDQIRHPRPQEVFSLLIANLENKLTPQQKAVANDMFTSYGEWLSAAAERNGDKLTVYIDPEGLVWNGYAYVKQNFKFGTKKEFSVQGIPSQSWQDLNKFDPNLVEFLYTRPFDKLPPVMQQGDRRAQVYLPPEGTIRPVGRGNFRFDFGYFYNSWASRGVVPSRAKKSGTVYRIPAMTEDEKFEEQVREVLSHYEQLKSPATAELHDRITQEALLKLKELYK